jgi:hypothetical protein
MKITNGSSRMERIIPGSSEMERFSVGGSAVLRHYTPRCKKKKKIGALLKGLPTENIGNRSS